MNQQSMSSVSMRNRARMDHGPHDEAVTPDSMHVEPSAAPFHLAPLPYSHNALEPVISKWTVALHHGQHERSYVDNLNRLVAGTEFSALSMKEIVLATSGKASHSSLFNNAAQAWNHAFYWKSLHPKSTGLMSAVLDARIRASFGSVGALKHALATAANSHFGSGWVWLAAAGTQLMVVTTSDAGNPMTGGLTPLLAIDLWEHAYYLDRQNRRDEYVRGILENHLNWEFASQNLHKR